jgi:hypothetical protein
MERVTVARQLDADAETVRPAVSDIEPFMRAAGFDSVTLDGDRFTISNAVGLATIELTLRTIDDPDCILAYEQTDGIFEEMVTRYRLSEMADHVEVSATTEFALKAPLIGPLLDATVIKRQRRIELNAQFDYLESLTE